ncbi:hypothetical protein D3C87_1251290 [compost metagenome]
MAERVTELPFIEQNLRNDLCARRCEGRVRHHYPEPEEHILERTGHRVEAVSYRIHCPGRLRPRALPLGVALEVSRESPDAVGARDLATFHLQGKDAES